MRKITFLIEPVPASRPRVTRWATYYQPKYTQFKKDMQKLLLGTEKTLYFELLKVDLKFFFTTPKSWSEKKKKEHDGTPKYGTPDLDNLEKAIYDSLNGYVWLDDSQVVDHRAQKFWTKGKGRIEITIERL